MGKGIATSAPIDESVGLLRLMNRNLLDDVLRRNPNFSSILEPGVIAGDKEVDILELEVRVELCLVTLKETLIQTKEVYLPYFKSKLRRLQKIELLTQIIIVIGSSTVFGLLTQDLKKSGILYGAYFGASLSLVGAILTIILKQNSGDWTMNNKNVASSFYELVDKRIRVEELLTELNIQNKFLVNNKDEVMKLIAKCNELNREVRTIIDSNVLPIKG